MRALSSWTLVREAFWSQVRKHGYIHGRALHPHTALSAGVWHSLVLQYSCILNSFSVNLNGNGVDGVHFSLMTIRCLNHKSRLFFWVSDLRQYLSTGSFTD